MQADEKEKMREKYTKIMRELDRWPEDSVKKLLEQRLKNEQWTISWIAFGHERGKDLLATKGARQIIIEVKGEPKSPLSYVQERRAFIRGAFASIVQHMREDKTDVAYCIAFPNNGYYPRRTEELLPRLVRSKLALNALFVNDNGILDRLLPNEDRICRLARFDDLFTEDSSP